MQDKLLTKETLLKDGKYQNKQSEIGDKRELFRR